MITYRIYLDLAPGYELVSVFGEKDRNLFFRTSTRFFNDTVHGAPIGDRIEADRLYHYPAAIDSWLAFGFASNAHKAVPLHLDTDGSVLRRSKPKRGAVEYELSLRDKDGLTNAAMAPEVMCLYLTTSFLDKLSGHVIETELGAYGVKGTVRGATPENMVLIAQLTTDGDLAYAINAAVKSPDGTITKWLAYPAIADDESQHPELRNGHVGEGRF
ncbi:MAG: hypothetical protein IPJ85_02505 [Flavobacteriales bacterium]|nr:hypothetical protein [Flavobacteriales bacterium]